MWSAYSLEQRVLLAGDAGAAVAAARPPAPADVAPPPLRSADSSMQEAQQVQGAKLVLIDASIRDADMLQQAADADAQIVLLDPNRELLTQIDAAITSEESVMEVHLVTHGQAGAIRLGDPRIDSATIIDAANLLRSWGRHLHADADILLYGCDVGGTAAGRELADALARHTGADVAISIDRTGAIREGGDWELEHRVGVVESDLALATDRLGDWHQTLDVSVVAFGTTGEEEFDLQINDVVVARFNAGTRAETFVLETTQNVRPQDVSVVFTNDLFLPEQNFDRNLIVLQIDIDGQTFVTASDTVRSTGTWRPGVGVVTGRNLGFVLQANGQFDYGQSGPESVLVNDQRWVTSDRSPSIGVSPFTGDLVVGPTFTGSALTGPAPLAAAYSFVPLLGGSDYQAQFDASLFTQPGRESQGYVGFDFFNEQGIEIGEAITVLDSAAIGSSEPLGSVNQDLGSVNLDFFVPPETAFATAWVALVNTSGDPQAHIRLSDLQFERIDGGQDSTPPTVSIANSSIEFFPNDPLGPSEPSVTVVLSDDSQPRADGNSRFAVDGDAFRIATPAGAVETVPIFTGGIDDETGDEFVIVGVPSSPGDTFESGTYELLITEGAIRDLAGNATAAGPAGTFFLDVQDGPADPNDVTPPTVELRTAVVNSDRPEFTVRASDSQSPITFNRVGEIVVTGPSGDRVQTFGIAGGAGENPQSLFELFVLGESGLAAGIYAVSVEQGYVIDQGLNVNPAAVLGTFEYV
ncbi:MAG: DUF4347 domain-containing protein, partial [Planctomycetota bacterium]